MKDKDKIDKGIIEMQNKEFFISEFDLLGGYTGNNLMDGYGPEQDADDI